MASRKKPISQRGKRAIRAFATTLPERGLLKPTELKTMIVNGRASFGIAESVSNDEILQSLLRQELLKEATLNFPSRRQTRYFRNDAHIFEVVLSAVRNSYLSHWTALYLHGLTEKEPGPIYVNSEQREKPQWDAELTQKSIDNAFKRPPRTTNNHTDYAGRRIYLLNGKFTGGLGLTEIQWDERTRVRLTDLERTLIDVTVRPHYSGGVSGVLLAYERASTRISVPRIIDLLDKLAYAYPYHQAIGFYLEATGRFSNEDLQPLQNMPMRFNFYLANNMSEIAYSDRWRMNYPKMGAD
jgi:hypothetical protein